MTPIQPDNQRVLDYIRDRLGPMTSAGQCVLHLAPGGVIKAIEWKAPPIQTADLFDEDGACVQTPGS